MKLKQIVLGTVALTLMTGLAGLALLAGGCATSAPGVTDTAGQFNKVIDAPPATVARAADAVIESYKFPVDSYSATKVDGHLVAHTAQGTQVEVWVNQADSNTSKVAIRIGLAGDEALSQQILEKIKERSLSTGAAIMGSVHGDTN